MARTAVAMTQQFYQMWQNTVPKDFMAHAACRGLDPNLFMPEIGDPGTEAKLICNGRPNTRKKPALPVCPVKDKCLEYALQLPSPVVGIWGGTSERERRLIRREASVRVRTRKQPTEDNTEPHHAWQQLDQDNVTAPALRNLVNLVHETHFRARREARENARASRTTL